MTAYTFDQIIDFTRTSAATYVANTGFVTQTPASRNLLTYTQEFDNAAWTKSNATALPFDPAAATYGPEVISNGDFATTASWTLIATAPATATIVGGKLTIVSPAGEAANANQAVLTVGKWYKITGDVTVRSGTVKVDAGNIAILSATQAFSVYLQATSATLFLSRNGACDADFDNISVREVIGGLITAPDGTLTGDALIATAGTAAHNIHQSGGGSGAAITMSIYAKAGTTSFVQLYHGAASTTFANFNLAAGAVGTVGAGATATITSVGNGWYRCTMTFTPGSASANRVAMISSATAAYNESWTATGTESIYLWGAQLEAASAATTYTRNVGGLYPPRFDYDPVTLAPRGLLIEEQRTNLLTYSEQFDNAAWVKANATVTANATTSPDGTVDADLLVASTSLSQHRLDFATTSTAATHAFSVYAKVGGYNFVYLRLGLNGGFVDLSSGTVSGVTGGYTMTATSVGNGWYRIVLVGAAALNETARINVCQTTTSDFTGNGTSGIYVWGAQLEAGTFATSYIPTVASQVTRTADLAAVTGANFSRWYNQSEGTFVVEAVSFKPTTVSAGSFFLANASDGTSSEQASIRITSTNVGGLVWDGGALQAGMDTAYATNSIEKYALALKASDFAFVRNGATPLTDSSGTMPTANRLSIGVNAVGTSEQLNGHIRRIRYYPVRLSNTQLQALTA